VKTACKFDVSDLWRPDQPLPGRPVLSAIAERCGRLWRMPDLDRRASIAYNQRLRSALGRAILDDSRVELNVRLLRKHPEHLVCTLVHELAHVAVHIRFGKVPPHGLHFRALMAATGLSPKATHSLPANPLKHRRRRYLYLHRCSDCGMTFIARKVRRDCYCQACGPNMSWTVLRAPATREGHEKLSQIAEGP